RTVSDLRAYDTGVEMYRIDHNATPPTWRVAGQTRTWMSHYLTTPVAYIHTAFPDVFNNKDDEPLDRVLVGWGYDFLSRNEPTFAGSLRGYPLYSDGSKILRPGMFYIFSSSPDMVHDINDPWPGLITTYDPSN